MEGGAGSPACDPAPICIRADILARPQSVIRCHFISYKFDAKFCPFVASIYTVPPEQSGAVRFARNPMMDQAGVDFLVQRSRLSDAAALEALYERFGRDVYRIAYRLTQSEEDAEDVLQDVFAGLPEALRTYQGRGALGDWLRMVVT